MNRARTIVLLGLALLVAACSMRSAIDALSSPEDRAFAQGFIEKMRRGDIESLQPLFEPTVWQESAGQIERAPALYPPTPGTTELIGYNVATNMANGVTTGTKEYTLVTHDPTHWTTTIIRTRSEGNGQHRIIGWNVEGSAEMPVAYRQFQAMDSMARGFWIGGLVFLVLIGGLIVFLIRRSRRKRRDPLMGQGPPPSI